MNFPLTLKIKSQRVIDFLRENYSGEWIYDKNLGWWKCSDGSYVCRCAALSPRYDGDDDTFVTQYWRYYPDKAPERIWL